MPRELKVYGWTGMRGEDPRNVSRFGRQGGQTREIVAARSVAEVVRLSGIPRHQLTPMLSETGNAHECQTALAEPGTVFWQNLHAPPGDPFYPADDEAGA